MARTLVPDDVLYRALQPDHVDPEGALAAGFEDAGKPYECLSFFVARFAPPSASLKAIAIAGFAKRLCGTRKAAPGVALMCERGFRVASLPASEILAAIAASGLLSIKREPGGHEIRADGHLNLHSGRMFAATWAHKCRLLEIHEVVCANQ